MGQIDALRWIGIQAMKLLYWRLPSWVERLPYTPALNYGYKSRAGNPIFSPEEMENRVQIRLYYHVAGAFLARQGTRYPLTIVEVGSGLGVGASWLASFLKDALSTLFGVDQSGRAIAFCKEKYGRNSKLVFQQGNAMRLPFANGSIDAVVNIESSHMYPDMQNFLDEVHRILKPGGFFLWADLRETHKKDEVLRGFARTFDILEEMDITDGVLRALESEEELKRKEEYLNQLLRSVSLPERLVLRFFLVYIRNFMGMEGSGVLEYFQNQKLVYLQIAAQKKAPF